MSECMASSGSSREKVVSMDCRITNNAAYPITLRQFNYVVYDSNGVKMTDRGMDLELEPGEVGRYWFNLGAVGNNYRAAKVVIR